MEIAHTWDAGGWEAAFDEAGTVAAYPILRWAVERATGAPDVVVGLVAYGQTIVRADRFAHFLAFVPPGWRAVDYPLVRAILRSREAAVALRLQAARRAAGMPAVDA